MLMVNMGERLRALRLEKRITQTEMSRRIGVSKAMLSAYELEQRAPSYEVLIRLAAFFGVTSDFLLGLEKSRTLDITGLSDKEVTALGNMIEVLKER
jgi:transcriptional regulator with XRE-family HTH domain